MTKEPATVSLESLSLYQSEVENEWLSILNYWMQNTVDKENGGFYGSVDNRNKPDSTASRGIVMYSRILWAFSAAYVKFKNRDYLHMAGRAFNYICKYFIDKEFGGVYWSVSSNSKMLNGRKQIYGLAFCIYGMSEYYKATEDEDALNISKELFYFIEKYSYDKEHGGYLEAFSRDWQALNDLRLSEKDSNEKKTMNTHLHVIEAYANLYTIWPDAGLKEKISGLLKVFDEYIINKDSFHLNLFMDERWKLKTSLISFGHDIEAAWLLLECANIIKDDEYIRCYREISVDITTAATEGLAKDGGLMYEYEPQKDQWIKEKHSWPQAEAMIGFMNAFQLTNDENFLQHSQASWAFVKNLIIDKNNGEWFWGVNENNSIMLDQDKAGFWKCPYHNTRACMEIIKRVDEIIN